MTPSAPNTLPEELPTRASLLARLGNHEDHASWREFFERYWRLIYHAAVRDGLSDPEAQEVVQEVVLHVSHRIAKFRYDPARSFKGWLLRATRWKSMDVHRQRQRRAAGAQTLSAEEGRLAMESVTIPPELEDRWDAEWEQALAAAALAAVKARVSAEQFQVFDLHVLQGRSVGEVARALGIASATVYVVKHRVSKVLRSEVERLRASPV